MSHSTLTPSWDMPLAQFREYFLQDERYQKFCEAYFKSTELNADSKKNNLHLAFSFLLGRLESDEAWQAYSQTVCDYHPSGIKINDGAIKQGINAVLGKGSSNSAEHEEWSALVTECRKPETPLTIRDAYKKVSETLQHKNNSAAYPGGKAACQILAKVLDDLLTPTDEDLIADRIEKGGCRQIILTGAPGTGKTTIARMVADSLGSTLDGKTHTLVQFHPSYDYTDFVEGLRPVPSNGNDKQIQFAKMDGSFKAFCRKVAIANGDAPTGNAPAERVKDDLKAFSAVDTFMAGIPHISTLIKAVEQSDEAAFQGAMEHILPISSTPAFPEDALSSAAHTLSACVNTLLCIRENGYIAPLFGLSAFLKREAIQTSGSADLEAVYDACYDLRDALTGSKQTPISSANAANAFGKTDNELFEVVKFNNKKNIFTQNRVTTKGAKTNWVTSNQTGTDAEKISISKLIELAADAYPITDEVRQAVQTLEDWDYQAYQEQQISAICSAMQALPVRTDAADKESLPLYFFIIDEINRANLSKVFGELMYGLEKDKRNTGFQTQYQNLLTYDSNGVPLEPDIFKEAFYIPENVVIIGTMNDIDRSVDSMDYALRRRFEWKEIIVNERTLSAAFTSGKYISAIREHQGILVARIMNLNRYIQKNGNPYNLNRQYFISQGQFSHLSEELTSWEAVLEYVWTYRIESLLREYLRGESETTIQDFIDGARKALMAE